VEDPATYPNSILLSHLAAFARKPLTVIIE